MFRSLVLNSSGVRISRLTSRIRIKPLLGASFFTGRPTFKGEGSPKGHLTALPGALLRCPKCNIVLPTPLPACPNCHYISRLDHTVPYHSLFQLPFEPNPFVVDTFKLKRRYLEAQKICHPDAWTTHGTVGLPALISIFHVYSWSLEGIT